MEFYLDGLFPKTRTIAVRFRESQTRCELTFEELTHFARAEGEAFSARLKQYKPCRNNYCSTRRSSSGRNKTEQVNIIAASQASDESDNELAHHQA